MIYRNGKEVILIYYGKRAVSAVYAGVRLVWQAIRSCFGSGAWFNDKPWLNDEGWKN